MASRSWLTNRVIVAIVRYTEELIGRISADATPENLVPAPPDAIELGREIADSISDSYTDEDWRRVLNGLSPHRAASRISRRPPSDRDRLLMLIDPDRRAEIKRLLAALAA